MQSSETYCDCWVCQVPKKLALVFRLTIPFIQNHRRTRLNPIQSVRSASESDCSQCMLIALALTLMLTMRQMLVHVLVSVVNPNVSLKTPGKDTTSQPRRISRFWREEPIWGQLVGNGAGLGQLVCIVYQVYGVALSQQPLKV